MQLPFTPLERVVETVVSPEGAGQTLLDYLSGRYDYLKPPQWNEQIALGNLRVNGTTAPAEQLLAAGDVIFFQARDLVEQPVSFDIGVVAETDDYIIVNKPGSLPTHPAGRFFNHTLWAWLKQCRHLESIHFVNRLDRETSGLVLVGKNPRFAAAAAKLMHSLGFEAHKSYSVVVWGRVPWTQYSAVGWLGKDPLSAVTKKRRFTPEANEGDSDVIELPADEEAVTCHTEFIRRGYCSLANGTQLRPDEQGEFTWLEARLHTGRTHQIRATLCSIGYPVLGDKLYGKDDGLFLKFAKGTLNDADWQKLILPTQALHAERLWLPRLGIEAYAPPPFIA